MKKEQQVMGLQKRAEEFRKSKNFPNQKRISFVIGKGGETTEITTDSIMADFAESVLKSKRLLDVDKFFEWLDSLEQSEYDDMSLTEKCEKFLKLKDNG